MSKLFLLSIEEVRKIPKYILSCDGWWWLRSLGNYSDDAINVDSDGNLYWHSYTNVNYSSGCVRPALILSSPLSELNLEKTKKGYIKLGKKENGKPIKWIDISEYIGKPCLLMKKPYEYHRFDAKSNVYATSEIKTRLEELDNILFAKGERVLIQDWSEL